MKLRPLLIAAACSAAFGVVFSAATAAGARASSPAASPAAQRPTAAVLDTGELAGAAYRIDIPAGWNGDLVMLLHGYEPKGMPRPTPMAQNEAAPLFLSQGYAVASSAYREQGWAVEAAREDNERLRAHFVEKYGRPGHTYVAGFSMGGQIVLATLEHHGAQYDGGLSLCGVNTSTDRIIDDGALTNLLAFDDFFPGVLGLAQGGLADPASPDMIDPGAVEKALVSDEAKAALLSKRLQIPREALAGAIMLSNLIQREMQTRVGGFPLDNTTTRYAGFGDDDAFNRSVRRYHGSPDAIRQLAQIGALSGRIDKPLVLLSNNADQTVAPRFAADYAQRARKAGRGKWLHVLPPAGSGHCGFANDDMLVGLRALERATKH